MPLVAALLCGALVAGCGGGGNSTTSGTTSTTAPAAASTSTAGKATTSTAMTQPSTTSTAGSPGSAAAVAQYVAVCKTIVKRAPTLSASVKAKVEGICEKAAKGDLAGARAAAREVCVQVVEASPVTGAAKQQALAECKKT